MSTAKTALTVTSLATALLFGGGLYLYMNIGSIAKTLAQDYSSKALGVPVYIGSVDIDIPNKNVKVSNVRITNPQGFNKKNAATIDTIDITANTLSRELLSFNDVSIKGADVYLEVNENGANLNTIKNNLNRSAGTPSDPSENPIKVILEKVLMEGTIHPSVSFLDRDFDLISLPPLTLTNIGKSQNGVLAGEAIAQIWKPLSASVMKSVQQAGYLDGLSIDSLKDMGQSRIDNAKEKLNEKLGGDVEGIAGGIKNLFE